jgi:cytochrome c oxidase subunit 2
MTSRRQRRTARRKKRKAQCIISPARAKLRAALTVALAASSLVVAACTQYPNSVFHSRTDTNRDVGFLFEILIWFGSIVFVVVEAILVYTLIRFRRRGATRQPEHVHGNTTLEITWTIIPAVILVFIAIPTVRTIFRTQAKASSDALEVEVVGHQWWWEFRYPQYTTRNPTGKLDTVVTANELYLPQGRMVNFALKTVDVIHSFWVPSLSGKRDLIANHTNYLWFTPDSATPTAYNGFCVEFCGASHANMRFRTFVVTPDEFTSWTAHQQTPAAFAVAAPGQAVATNAPAAAPSPAAGAAAAPSPASSATPVTPVAQAGFIAFPRDRMPAYTVPETPIPADMPWTPVQRPRGQRDFTRARAPPRCHTIRNRAIGQVDRTSRHQQPDGMPRALETRISRSDQERSQMKPGVLILMVSADHPRLGTTVVGLTDQNRGYRRVSASAEVAHDR